MKNPALVLGAVFGLIGVGLGAFGAHGLEDVLKANDRLATWDTAVLYQFVHSGLLLVLGILALHQPGSKLLQWSARASLAGIVIFSGTLYALSLTNIRWLGAITPLGGLSFMVAWTLLIIHALKKQ